MSSRRLLPFALLVAACGSSGSATSSTAPAPAPTAVDPTSPADEPVEARLARYLDGRYDSTDQAKADKTYFAISLAVCPVDAPELGDRVLYVEQARVNALPYRQRLYVVERVDATAARSRVFELKDPGNIIGACKLAQRPTLRAIDAIERPGCVVEMHWTGDSFLGHTPDAKWNGSAFEPDPTGARCESSLEGASYATTEVTLGADGLRSWDRGWDTAGQQVWGATAGAYVFVRRTTLEQP
jgi:CpeT protein